MGWHDHETVALPRPRPFSGVAFERWGPYGEELAAYWARRVMEARPQDLT